MRAWLSQILCIPSCRKPLSKSVSLPSDSLALGSGSEFISGSTLRSRNFSQLGKPCQKHFSRLFCFQVNVIGERAKVELLEPGFCFVAGPSLSIFLWIPGCKLHKALSPFSKDLWVCGQKPDRFGEPLSPVCRVRHCAASVACHRPSMQAPAGPVEDRNPRTAPGWQLPTRCRASTAHLFLLLGCILATAHIYIFLLYTVMSRVSVKDFMLWWDEMFP